MTIQTVEAGHMRLVMKATAVVTAESGPEEAARAGAGRKWIW